MPGKVLTIKRQGRKQRCKSKGAADGQHTPRDDVEHIMDSFPIVKRRDEEKHGSFRTKEMILREYDKLAGSSLVAPPKTKRRVRGG